MKTEGRASVAMLAMVLLLEHLHAIWRLQAVADFAAIGKRRAAMSWRHCLNFLMTALHSTINHLIGLPKPRPSVVVLRWCIPRVP